MKRTISITCALLAALSLREARAVSYDMQMQMLDSEIARLTAEKQQKYAELEKCAGSVKGFKIAGISLIGLTAGLAVYNIHQAGVSKGLTGQIAAAEEKKAQREAEELRRQQEDQARQVAEAVKQAEQVAQPVAPTQTDVGIVAASAGVNDAAGCVIYPNGKATSLKIGEVYMTDFDKGLRCVGGSNPIRGVCVYGWAPHEVNDKISCATSEGKAGMITCMQDGASDKWSECVANNQETDRPAAAAPATPTASAPATERECTNGETVECPMPTTDGSSGKKTCTNGKWGGCVIDPSTARKETSRSCLNLDNNKFVAHGKIAECTMPIGIEGEKTCENGRFNTCKCKDGAEIRCDMPGGKGIIICENGKLTKCSCREGTDVPCPIQGGGYGRNSCIDGKWSGCKGSYDKDEEIRERLRKQGLLR